MPEQHSLARLEALSIKNPNLDPALASQGPPLSSVNPAWLIQNSPEAAYQHETQTATKRALDEIEARYGNEDKDENAYNKPDPSTDTETVQQSIPYSTDSLVLQNGPLLPPPSPQTFDSFEYLIDTVKRGAQCKGYNIVVGRSSTKTSWLQCHRSGTYRIRGRSIKESAANQASKELAVVRLSF